MKTYQHNGADYTARQLAALPEAREAKVTLTQLRVRLSTGWLVADAISTPPRAGRNYKRVKRTEPIETLRLPALETEHDSGAEDVTTTAARAKEELADARIEAAIRALRELVVVRRMPEAA